MFSGWPPTADLRLGAVATWVDALIEVSCRPYFKSPNWDSNNALRLTDYEWPAMRSMLPNRPHGVPHVGNAAGNPLDVLLDRYRHVAKHRRAARTGNHEQVRKASDLRPK